MAIGGDELARLIFNYDDVPERLTQDSPVAADVWARYDEAGDDPVDLILVPHRDRSAGALTSALRDRLARAGATGNTRRLAYAGTYVTARLTLPEMIWVALPLTRWWNEKLLKGHHLVREQVAAMAAGATETERDGERHPIARQTPWLVDIAGRLAWEARGHHGKPTRAALAGALLAVRPDLPNLPIGPPLLWEIDANRPVRAALWRSRQAVKADVAERTFEPDITDLGWAVLDSGVDARHPAFRVRGPDGKLPALPPKGKDAPSFAALTRVVRTYDFTRLRDVLEGSLEPVAAAPGTEPVARKRPPRIDEDLHRSLISGRSVDWALIEPHIRVEHDGRYRPPLNPHGTHVAGIIGGDWRPGDSPGAPEKPLRGVAAGLEIYDLRVLDDRGGGEEFAVLAAMAFLRWLNAQSDRMLVHGVNLSLSLDHDVLNSACGRSPVCVEATRAHESGIVVVAAAGNAGQCDYSYQGVTAPGYRTVSITDPGNADAVITVGATHRVEPHTYGVSYFSSRGPTGDGRVKPDLVAPGEKIVGPLPGDRYARMDGTSMAAPHVSGAAALLMGRHRELIGEPDVIKKTLSERATDLGRENYFQGHGMLDILRSMESL
jgi:subtilisin family serine protease